MVNSSVILVLQKCFKFKEYTLQDYYDKKEIKITKRFELRIPANVKGAAVIEGVAKCK